MYFYLMKVYYSRGWAITFIVVGSILIALNYILFNLTGKMEAVRIVPGFMVIGVGILYLFRPYFELQEESLVTFSLLGFIAWRYSFDEISDLVFEGNKLYRNKNGRLKRIRISKFVCNKEQWERFRNKVEGMEPGFHLHE